VRVSAAALSVRRRVAVPSFTPRLRRRLAALVVVALTLAAGYHFWLRDSSFVAVDDVKVTGLTTDDSERVRSALRAAGHTMTTLHVDRDALEQAVAHYPVVRELQVRPDFPHGLTIHVIEHHAAALLELGGKRVPVAGDGTILRGLPVEGRFPSIDAGKRADGDRLTDADALGAARLAGAAPAPLRKRVESIAARSDDGLVATLSDGPELIFGDSSRARTKWIAAARVLADPEADGATYIDLRQPDRPAAGGLPAATVAPVAPAGAAALGAQAAPAGQTPVDPTAAPPTGAADPAAGVTLGAATPESTATAPAQVPQGTTQTPAAGVGATGQTQAGGAGAPPG
jgi:cell division protein FtsQ